MKIAQNLKYLGAFIALATALSGCGGDSNSSTPATGGSGTTPPPTPVVMTEWNWLGGKTPETDGTYGALGVVAAGDQPGGRIQAASWTDKDGNYWLFGGYGFDSANINQVFLNDVWVFRAKQQQWEWVAGPKIGTMPGIYGTLGTGSTQNVPGGRSAASYWVDAAGRFWLFAGYGLDSMGNAGYLNDLWMFDPTTLMWTWVSGSNLIGSTGTYTGAATTLVPAARYAAGSWVDSAGRFWIFGGDATINALPSYSLNDMWMYDPSSTEWTFVGGSTSVGASGSYGNLGVAAPANQPGARVAPSTWTDSAGNLWMFGGEIYSTSPIAYVGDMWRFDTKSMEWTWVAGSQSTALTAPVYGKLGIAAAANTPGSRINPATWTDGQGGLWLFGGFEDNTGMPAAASDMWKFDSKALTWTWESGTAMIAAPVKYGKMGVAAKGNTPGGLGSATFATYQGHLLMFGGATNTGNAPYTDALWEY